MSATLLPRIEWEGAESVRRTVSEFNPAEATVADVEGVIALVLDRVVHLRKLWETNKEQLDQGMEIRAARDAATWTARTFSAWLGMVHEVRKLAATVEQRLGRQVTSLGKLDNAEREVRELMVSAEYLLSVANMPPRPFPAEMLTAAKAARERGDEGEAIEDVIGRLQGGSEP
jgi:hypothetical protein